jgi:hypothetical protein
MKSFLAVCEGTEKCCNELRASSVKLMAQQTELRVELQRKNDLIASIQSAKSSDNVSGDGSTSNAKSIVSVDTQTGPSTNCLWPEYLSMCYFAALIYLNPAPTILVLLLMQITKAVARIEVFNASLPWGSLQFYGTAVCWFCVIRGCSGNNDIFALQSLIGEEKICRCREVIQEKYAAFCSAASGKIKPFFDLAVDALTYAIKQPCAFCEKTVSICCWIAFAFPCLFMMVLLYELVSNLGIFVANTTVVVFSSAKKCAWHISCIVSSIGICLIDGAVSSWEYLSSSVCWGFDVLKNATVSSTVSSTICIASDMEEIGSGWKNSTTPPSKSRSSGLGGGLEMRSTALKPRQGILFLRLLRAFVAF